jgi:hypothetical protein
MPKLPITKSTSLKTKIAAELHDALKEFGAKSDPIGLRCPLDGRAIMTASQLDGLVIGENGE